MIPKSLCDRIRGNTLEHYLTPEETETILYDLAHAKLVTAVEKEFIDVMGERQRAVEIRIVIKL